MSLDEIHWSPGAFTLTLSLADGVARLSRIHVGDQDVIRPADPLPLVEIGVAGSGRSWSARRYVDSLAGHRLIYQKHVVQGDELVVTSRDKSLEVVTTLTAVPDSGAVRIRSRLVNTGSAEIGLTWVTSAVWGGTLAGAPFESLRVWWADNDWLAENRWTSATTREILPDLNWEAHKIDPRGTFARTALGAWSTDGTLPLGVVTDESSGLAVGWQLEHNGGWHWQAGERADGLYVSLLGPTETEHDWYGRLAAGEEFTTVPVTVAFATDGFEGVVAALTAARRQGRRSHPDHTGLPVIFNDYMNTLMGDPTTAKLLPLIDAAAEVGAETFCIDAGWYDDDAQGWWDSVGAWEPAPNRFPGGLCRRAGPHPRARHGAWAVVGAGGRRRPEPDRRESAGRGVLPAARRAESSSTAATTSTCGIRWRASTSTRSSTGWSAVSASATSSSTTTSTSASGPTTTRSAAGAGLLGHNRALLQWIDGVLDRYPHLTLENCSSGGMRVDYAMLSHLQVQSTSDQQDPLYYPPVAAAAAAAVAPEQAASWTYPQPTFSDELIAFTMAAGMLGRLHLSGHLDKMTDDQRALVAEAITAYRSYRPFVATAVPFWPLGLPGWEDPWIAHGLRDDRASVAGRLASWWLGELHRPDCRRP